MWSLVPVGGSKVPSRISSTAGPSPVCPAAENRGSWSNSDCCACVNGVFVLQSFPVPLQKSLCVSLLKLRVFYAFCLRGAGSSFLLFCISCMPSGVFCRILVANCPMLL